MSLWTWLRGLALLRHPELVADLGRRLGELRTIEDARQAFPEAVLSPEVRLLGFSKEHLSLGTSTRIEAGTILSLGQASESAGSIHVGDRTWIGQYNNLRSGHGSRIEIGDDCLISQFCTLVATNHCTERSTLIRAQGHDPSRTDIHVGCDVWLGAGVTVLPGVSIGDGAVIGAGSVVTRSVPSYEIWAGAPAHRIGLRKDSECPQQNIA